MTKSDPWLSVVLPTYNGAEYIRDTLESLAAQTEGGFEVLVIDEASSDGTPEIVAEYSDRFPVRQIDGDALHGWIAKTNEGFRLARTPFATMLHQDDFWRPTRVASLRAALADAPEPPAFIIHPVDFVDEAGETLGPWRLPPALKPGLHRPTEVLARLCVQNFVAIPGCAFSSEVARKVGGVDAEMKYTGDWDFYLKLAAEGPTLVVDEALSAYRLHGGALTIAVARDAALFADQLAAPLARHLPRVEEARRARIRRKAEFSNLVNAALAGRFHGRTTPWRRLIGAALRLGPVDLCGYVSDSRIVDRAKARLRMKKS